MTRTQQALCWALALIALALSVSTGLVDRQAAEPLFFAGPVLAYLSITDRVTCCNPFRGARA
ncbi:hypothetical protein OZN62_07630 [Aurantiacibacter sp. MUD11]|uniref:hypothetical protein n=1 Tax=Aurantiacibacter sp. MUD11 TaxID=3003265 RepID=UPI0022AAB515|nr:hypothetical protein [Aurantiacibacter sp. MUD11]WAT16816.1 hypothetical protein OZN62_07630 [Aurantiacibacter sp. MUD11]